MKKLNFLVSLFFLIFIYQQAYAQCSFDTNDGEVVTDANLGSISSNIVLLQIGQSFVACDNGILNSISIYSTSSTSGIELTIYEGAGLQGTALGSVSGLSVTPSSSVNDRNVLDISSAGINVTSGNTYTVAVTAGFIFTRSTNFSIYSGGHIFIGTNVHSDLDLLMGAEIVSEAPIFENSTPHAANITGTTLTLNTDINEAGEIFYVALEAGANAPTLTEVVNGTGSGGSSSVTSGNASVSSGSFTHDFSVIGLTSEMDYDIYVVARDNSASPNLQSSPTKVSVTTADITAPSISSVSLDSSNGFIDVTFIEGVFNTGSGSGAIELSDFDLSLIGGMATNPTVTSVTPTGTGTLVGGETTVRVHFTYTGLADGTETLEVDLADGSSVFDLAANAAAADQTANNTVTLNSDGPFFSTSAAQSVAEGNTPVVTLAATGIGTINYSIIGGDDQGLFSLSGANLSFTSAPDFENPTDNDTNNDYIVEVQATDGVNTSNLTITVSVTDQNDNAPVFSTSTTQSVDENTTSVVTLASTDGDAGSSVSYSIIGGDDQGLFSLTGANLSFTSAPDFENPTDNDTNNDYIVEVQATDGANTSNLTITVSVTDQNDNAPLFSTLTTQSVDENTTSVVTLASTDGDAGSSVSYSIIGGDDQGLFSLSGANLSFTSAPDFENPTDNDTNNDYIVEVQATDGVNTSNLTITVSVTDQNDNAPVFSTSTTQSVDENTTSVVTLASTDGDPGSSVSYSIIGGDDQGLFSLTGANLSFTSAPDFENPTDNDTNNDYIVEVQATDGANTSNLTITVSVTDQNDNAPLFSTLTTQSVDENTTSVVTLASTDGDAGSSVSYSIIGGDDQGLFSLTGANLSFTSAPDFENPTDNNTDNDYVVQVQATDGANTTDLTIKVTVTDVDDTSPTIISTSPVDGAIDVALTSDIVINFDEDITFGTGNIQIIDLKDGSSTTVIDVTSPGTNAVILGNVLTMSLSTDLDLDTEYAVQIANTAIDDLVGNSFAGITDFTTISFTTIPLIVASLDDPIIAEGDSGSTTLTFAVTLDKPANSGVSFNYVSSDGTATAGSDYTAVSGTVSFAAGDTSQIIDVIISTDNMVETNETITMTLSNPTVTNVILGDPTGTGTITNDDTAAVTIEDVTAQEDNGDLTFTATLDNAVQGGFTVDVSSADGTAEVLDNDYTAIAGQTLTFAGTVGETQVFTLSPTADMKVETDETVMISQGNLGGTSLTVDIADTALATFTNDDTTEVTIDADVNVDEDADNAILTATLSNPVQGGFFIHVTTADGTAVATDDYTAFNDQSNTDFTGTAGETQNLLIPIIDDSQGELSETFTVTLSSVSGTTLGSFITTVDAATVTIIDNDAPVVSQVQVPADGLYGIGDDLDFTVTFTDFVTTTGTPIIPITIGSTTVNAELDAPVVNSLTAVFSYTVLEVQLDTDGIGVGTDINLNGGTIIGTNSSIDAILTLNSVGSTANVNVDGIRPIPVITSTVPDPTNAAFDITITFDEPVTGFTLAGIDVGNGTPGALSGSGTTYTATITPTADGDVNIMILPDAAFDAAGNGNDVSNEFEVLYDATRPIPTVSSTAPDPTNMIFDVTISFTEDVTGFELSDISVDNGSAGNFIQVSSSEYMATITPTSDGEVIVSVPENVSEDAAINGNVDSNEFTIEYDSTPPQPPLITHISEYTCSGTTMMTGDNTLEIIGTAERESTVEVFLDGISIGTTITDADNGFFTFDYTGTTLADGTYTFTAIVTDAAINTGGVSEPVSITINTVDSDGDGNPDFCDDDDDGNGIIDAEEDCDEDGIVDSQDNDIGSCRIPILETRTYGFSPNEDGINERWVIENITAFPNNKVSLYSRSGKLVFKQSNYQNDFKGISNQISGNGFGKKLPVGSYIFLIDLADGSSPVRGWLYINY